MMIKRKMLLPVLVILSFMLLTGCGGLSSKPTPTPVLPQAEDETWLVNILSIKESNERISVIDGSYTEPKPGAVFLIIEANVFNKSTESQRLDDVKLKDIGGNDGDFSAINGSNPLIISPDSIMWWKTIEPNSKQIIEFVFAIPQEFKPDTFHFMELPPIPLIDITGN